MLAFISLLALTSSGVLAFSPPPSDALVSNPLDKLIYGDDFGYQVHELPNFAFCPSSPNQLRGIVRWAFKNKIAMSVRGRGHSGAGQSQSNSAVIDMGCMTKIWAPDLANGLVKVEAGASWEDISQALLKVGHRPVVQTEAKILSIGGTLSIGGAGTHSSQQGFAGRHVVDMHVVTGRGKLVRCNPNKRPQLFRGILGGQGQAAVIAVVTIRIVPISPNYYHTYFLYNDLNAAWAKFTGIVTERTNQAGFDSAIMTILPNTEYGLAPAQQLLDAVPEQVKPMFSDQVTDYIYMISAAGDNVDPIQIELLSANHIALPPVQTPGVAAYVAGELSSTPAFMAAMQNPLYYSPRHILHFISSTTGADDVQLVGFLGQALEQLKTNPAASIGIGLFHQDAMDNSIIAPLPQGPHAFNMAIIQSNPLPDTEAHLSAAAVALGFQLQHDGIFSAIKGMRPDTKLYPYGYTPAGYTWREHYGQDYLTLRRLKRQYNSGGVLGRGVPVFQSRPE